MPKLPELAPMTLGVNVMVTAHEAPTASGDAHVFACENDVEFTPVIVAPVTDRTTVPVLVSVIF